MEQELSFVINAKNNAEKAFKEVEKGIAGMQKKLKDMQPAFKTMAVVGTAAFAAITAVIGTSIKAFQAQEKAEARLTQIAKQVTKATEEEIEGFKKLARELQKVGVVGDDVIIAGQSQIASFTKSSKVVSILSKGLADLAVAQYDVNVTQEQAIQTGNLLGKALQGQLGALTRAGILVSGDFKAAFEAANGEQERAIVLSQIIEDNYGGVNAAMLKTSAGGMQALKNQFGDMQEVIGKQFIPILASLMEKLVPIIVKISEWVEKNPKLTKDIVLVSGAVTGLVAVLGILGLILPPVIVAVGALSTALVFLATNPVVWIIAAFVALAAIMIYLAYTIITNWDIIQNGIMKVVTDIKNWLKAIWDVVAKDMTEAWNGIADMFKAIWDVIGGYFKEKIDWIMGLISPLLSAIEKVSSFVGGGISKVGGAVFSALNVDDAIITPQGKVIQTDPADYLIATKNPGALAGGGAITVNIMGGYYLSETAAEEMGDKIIDKLKRVMKL